MQHSAAQILAVQVLVMADSVMLNHAALDGAGLGNPRHEDARRHSNN
jgi:hypothetical protein